MVDKKSVVYDKIRRYVESITRFVDVDRVVLYGSWAKGNPTAQSDIDLAIFSAQFGKNRLREMQLLSELAWDIDASIEAVPYPASLLSNNDPAKFVYQILQMGETVYGKPNPLDPEIR